jgi:hypothetical protein
MDMEHQMNHKQHYIRFGVMIALSFVAMYIFMYAMVDVFANAVPNINQFYMAGLMTAPMVIFELLLMGMMYPNRKLNLGIIVASIALLLFFWFGIREQIGVGDEQFLKSMIPHHSGAILMCEKANISDPEVKQLCQNIITSQQEEVDQMRSILERID